MRPREPNGDFWRGRSVLITGHTGFKGSWLARWLAGMGADIHGLALDPPTRPSMFEVAKVGRVLSSDLRVDARDALAVKAAISEVDASVVFHLAAQPLVRDGYRMPAETIATNALGTVNVLDAAREAPSISGIVVVTTDKVYLPAAGPSFGLKDNESDSRREWRPHREEDRLGGVDPYASSKVMAEHAVEGFRSLPAIDSLPPWSIPIATARAGNVIGGGDWSGERLVPDAIRALESGEPLMLRFPRAVRPWQHVLEPLCGYLLLAESLVTSTNPRFCRAFNFGPNPDAECTVSELADSIAEKWKNRTHVIDASDPTDPYENPVLRLDSTLAKESLQWAPRWDLNQTVQKTVDWYQSVMDGADAAEVTDRQIQEYLEVSWQ